MAHYGILVPPYTGHLNPILVLARALARRGHRITLFSLAHAADATERAGIEFRPIAQVEFPPGKWEALTAAAGRLTGLRATAAAAQIVALLVRGAYREMPAHFTRDPLDGLIMDQTCVGTESLCETWGIPLAVACCALPLHFDAATPPPYFVWRRRPGWWFRLRNLAGLCASDASAWRVVRETTRYRIRHGQPAMGLRYFNELKPSLVQVAQQPAAFDFPARVLPTHFHYTGPWVDERAESVEFPWERLDGRPLIYASLGTLQNRIADTYRRIAEACEGLPAQLVLSLGRAGAERAPAMPPGPMVVDYAPQKALLQRATLTISHGGLNTTLESLRVGVPVVAIPITNDQPGIAIRLEHLGLGAFVAMRKLTSERLRAAVRRVLEDPDFRTRAAAFAERLRPMDGAAVAAELIETALTTRTRVNRADAGRG